MVNKDKYIKAFIMKANKRQQTLLMNVDIFFKRVPNYVSNTFAVYVNTKIEFVRSFVHSFECCYNRNIPMHLQFL